MQQDTSKLSLAEQLALAKTLLKPKTDRKKSQLVVSTDDDKSRLSINQTAEPRMTAAATSNPMSKTDNLMNLAGQIRAAMDAKKKLRGGDSDDSDEDDSDDDSSSDDEWSD